MIHAFLVVYFKSCHIKAALYTIYDFWCCALPEATFLLCWDLWKR